MQRWLTAVEVAGLAAVAAGVSGFAFLVGGALAGVSAFAIAAGSVAIYEARAFAYSVALAAPGEAPADA